MFDAPAHLAYDTGMKKTHVMTVFGGPTKLSRAIGISRQALHVWPEELPQATIDRLIGLAFRLGLMRELIGASKLDGDRSLEPPDASPKS